MGLERYRSRRDFHKTREPRGRVPREAGRRYVIQEHASRRHHYDLRLELEGVLKSWAVPKGPSKDPQTRRLAIEVEDHPIEYGEFEGVIPAPEYGAGTVLLWDRGTWEPEGDPVQGYRKGHLRFRLDGERLHGEWTLVRTARDGEGAQPQWLLIKLEDEHADGAAAEERGARSVLTRRTLEEIRRGQAPHRQPRPPASPATGAPPPQWLAPQLASAVARPPEGEGWLHEIKFDGYRTACRIEGGGVQLFSRNAKDWTMRFAALADALTRLPVTDAWLDGEVALVQSDGTTSFSALQQAISDGRDGALTYFLFDLLYLDGRDLRHRPLTERKQALATLLAGTEGPLRLSDHVQGSGGLFFEHACALGLEGVVSKRADGPYRGVRTSDWQKAKCLARQEFVIGGYTERRGRRSGFGALLVGYYRQGRLHYAGRVGTGFSEQTLRILLPRLQQRRRAKTPFADAPSRGGPRVHWVAPELVVEVAFTGWTADGLLRMAVFEGVREDKPAEAVVREPPSHKPRARRSRPAAAPRLSHPEKLLYPELGVSKRALAEYYTQVGPAMLPELADRPLTLLRCPDGHHRGCFFQKHADEAMPASIVRVPILDQGQEHRYTAVNSVAGLLALVQMGVLEIHVWGARRDRLQRPDRMLFDLDPAPDMPWSAVTAGARDLRILLGELGLQSFVRSTGGKGLHVVVPLIRRHRWEEVKAFSRAVAQLLARSFPDRYVATVSKAARPGRIYIDYLRNDRGATAIANYSTRARAGAPVAVPLSWEELDSAPLGFDVKGVPERLRAGSADPWAGLAGVRQSLTRAMFRRLGLDQPGSGGRRSIR